eukprot:3641136-Alexandrium_andersonii.AAC.1
MVAERRSGQWLRSDSHATQAAPDAPLGLPGWAPPTKRQRGATSAPPPSTRTTLGPIQEEPGKTSE